MFKTLIGKFTFFFWLFFLLVIIPIYIFSNFHFKDILEESEKEKITLTLNTIKPIIALNLSFNQQDQLRKVLNSILKNNDIKEVRLNSNDGLNLFFKSKQDNNIEKKFQYQSPIIDPFSKSEIAKITLLYSNKHLSYFNNKIFTIFFSIFAFAVIVFLISFIYLHNDLRALRIIADSLEHYSPAKDIKLITHSSRVEEIQTISNVANRMIFNIAQYVQQLESFNVELEVRVKEEIEKQQNQERLMIHQSRQAAMGEMLESIAHQWRQPLNIIGIASANLETEYTLGIINKKKFHEKMEIISANINYMSDTIDDFRNFLNPCRETTNFYASKIIQDVFTILHAQLENSGIVYNFNIDFDLYFCGIENEFKQVIFILLNNSKDAIKKQLKEGNIKEGEISISFSEENSYGVVEISDNGGGVDTAIIDSIFEAYFSTKFNANGTGIGLYIAKNIIESRMKGQLSVRNIEGGCCFRIKLPMVKDINI